MACAYVTANVVNDFNPSLKMTQVYLKKKPTNPATMLVLYILES